MNAKDHVCDSTHVDVRDYDPFDPDVHADPDPWYDHLREHCPVHHHPVRDFYTVSRSEDILRILQHPRQWSSRFRNGLSYRPPAAEPMLLDADPPTHTWQRRLLQRAWTPRYVAQLEGRARHHVGERFAAIAALGRADFHAEVSSVVPVAMIAELVGVPPADHARFKAWSDAKVEVTAGTPGAEVAEAVADREVAAYFADHVAQRRADLAAGRPVPQDYTSMMLLAETDGRRLTDDEVRKVLQLLMLGGIETTTLLLGNLLHRVIVEPGLEHRLRSAPHLVETAVEESLRLDAPTLGLFRTPVADETVSATDIPKDAKTMVLFAAVNRDPALWAEPNRFDVDRDPVRLRQHLAFGHGVHLCLGAPLARLEGKVVLEAIIRHLPGVRYTSPPRRLPTMILRGFDRQDVEWDVVGTS
jgi:cytochrome P450